MTRCPMCGWDTNRKSLTIMGDYESIQPLCAKCHEGVKSLIKHRAQQLLISLEKPYLEYSLAWRRSDVQ